MEKNGHSKEVNNVLFANAFRFGIQKRDGEDAIVFDFGKAMSDDTSDKQDVEQLIRIAIRPDDLKVLLLQIVQTGIHYKSDFWKDVLKFDETIEDGDDSGNT